VTPGEALAALRAKHLDAWLPAWLADRARRAALRLAERDRFVGPRHVLFAFCDHYEPLWGGASIEVGRARVERWCDGYPRMVAPFRDDDGNPPRHTFFFPGEQYDPVNLDALAGLVRAGLGEIELHLHHDGDTGPKLRADLRDYLAKLGAHGCFAREEGGRPRFGFIHGNWCLANARRDGRWCGVDDELAILFEEGCFADFTFPSAPDECQPSLVNQLWWPRGDVARRRAHERGERARVGRRRDDRLLMIAGPIALSRRAGSLRPRIEAAAVTARDPATAARVRTWLDQAIVVDGRPEWIFVKVHTHGAPEREAASLLGAPGAAMHQALRAACVGLGAKLHYVTAREMFNVAIAAMDGRQGDPAAFRDYAMPRPPAR
jgi:hypothetical protein